MTQKSYCLAGPTSSGKTALSLWLARRLGLEVINADSLQLYEDLPLLTARPLPHDTEWIPHHLYGFLMPTQAFSVGKWHDAVGSLFLKDPSLVGRALCVGGTGLYFKVLLEGLAKAPPVGDDVRARLDDLYESQGKEGLQALWVEEKLTDPIPLDPQRLMRALGVYLTTKKPLSQWQDQGKTPPLLSREDTCSIVIMPEKSDLVMRATERLKRAMQESIPEVEALLARHKEAETYPLMQALGARELLSYCQGKCSFDDAFFQAQMRTRQYIKRQLTWFRHQMQGCIILETTDLQTQQKILEETLFKNF
jgi:tRNA dimethylallyltransferase